MICYGNFAGLEDCDIKIYYCPFSEIVYNIIIENNCGSDTIFNTICQAYTSKYGTPTNEYDSHLEFSISKFETIRLWKSYSGMTIEYLDSRWADYDDDKIKQKLVELASEMQNKIIGGI